MDVWDGGVVSAEAGGGGVLTTLEPISILSEAEELTNGARRQAYGHPLLDYERTAGMVNAALAHKLKEPLTPEEVMVVMILVKVSRQMNAPKRDNLVDIAGYANCIDMAQQERERRGNP